MMNIVNKTKMTNFNDLDVGDVFTYGKNIFVKIKPSRYEEYNALCLSDFELQSFDDSYNDIILVSSELIIKS